MINNELSLMEINICLKEGFLKSDITFCKFPAGSTSFNFKSQQDIKEPHYFSHKGKGQVQKWLF